MPLNKFMGCGYKLFSAMADWRASLSVKIHFFFFWILLYELVNYILAQVPSFRIWR